MGNVKKSVLECFLQFLVFFMLLVIVCFEPLGFGEQELWRCMMIVLPVVAARFIRKKIASNSFFYVLHGALLAAAVMFGRDENEGFFYFIVVAILVGYSSFVRFRSTSRQKECPPLYFLVVMLAAYISGVSYGTPFVSNIAVAVSALYVVAYIVCQNASRLGDVCDDNAGTANFPQRQLVLVNQYILVLTIAGVLLAMGIGFLVGSGDFGFVDWPLKAVARGIASLIIGIIVLLGKLQKNSDYSDVENNAGEDAEEMGNMGLPVVDSDLEKWINAAIIVAAIIILVVLAVLLIRTLNDIMKRRMSETSGNDTAEFIKPDDKVESLKPKWFKTSVNKKNALSNNERFRRLYRKTIVQNIRKNKLSWPAASLVPSRLTSGYVTDGAAKDVITEYYEKARYSKEELGEEAVELLKRMDS